MLGFQQIVIGIQATVGLWLAPFDLLIYQIVTDSKAVFTIDNYSFFYPNAVKTYDPTDFAFVAPFAGIFGCQIGLRAGQTLAYGATGDLNYHICNISFVQDESDVAA
jgi:hypothetical protein